jgi:predicted DNA-binding transcriptional regulator AlpA
VQTDTLIGVKAVADLLGCSWRTALRWADTGLMPWGVKIGAARRWSAAEIQNWIAGGCKPVRKAVSA